MAAGRVITGFSKPYVALYSAEGGTISYTDAQLLARGVEVSIEPEVSSDNIFYADNQQAETAAGTLTGGTVTLTVDGLKDPAAKMILGLPDVGSDGFTAYDDTMQIPNVGIGFVVRYQEDQVVTYVPIVLVKTQFAVPGTSAATQEEDIDWQTQELTATIMRGDDATHTWKYVGTAETTEAAAEAKIQAKLGVSSNNANTDNTTDNTDDPYDPYEG